jgi:hypothetical protein
LQFYVYADGDVWLPDSLRDNDRRHAITIACRAAVLQKLAEQFERVEAYNARRLCERRSPTGAP